MRCLGYVIMRHYDTLVGWEYRWKCLCGRVGRFWVGSEQEATRRWHNHVKDLRRHR